MLRPVVWYIVTDISEDPSALLLRAKQSKLVARRKILFYIECGVIQQFANFKYSVGRKGILEPMLLWVKNFVRQTPLLLTSLLGKTLLYFLRNKWRESGMNLVSNCTDKFLTIFPRIGKTALSNTSSLPTPGLSTKPYQFQNVFCS
jgi:hypothetical protein